MSEAKQSRMLASREIEEQDLDPALVKLGDASIASPFTAKTTSVGSVLAVVRQGRCTLVTTLQVYKVREENGRRDAPFVLCYRSLPRAYIGRLKLETPYFSCVYALRARTYAVCRRSLLGCRVAVVPLL